MRRCVPSGPAASFVRLPAAKPEGLGHSLSAMQRPSETSRQSADGPAGSVQVSRVGGPAPGEEWQIGSVAGTAPIRYFHRVEFLLFPVGFAFAPASEVLAPAGVFLACLREALFRRSARLCLSASDNSVFLRKGFVLIRKGQAGQLVATHLRTSLASSQQQSRQRARMAFTGFCALNFWDRISVGTFSGLLPISSPRSIS